MSEQYLLPKSYQKQSVTIQKNVVMYWIFSFMEHYAPAVVIDAILSISGRKPKLVSLYRFYEKAMKTVQHFVFSDWNFHTQNFKNLELQLNSEEKENLYLSLQGFGVKELAEALPTGAPFYRWEVDRKRIGERKRITQLRYLLTSSIQAIVLMLILFVIYLIISPFLQIIKVVF
ncbi:fatty acyl-CoA reductase [Trichonephila clavipes]|nr:fatty acyl-CoA reductase [Trichonephila clavipes]